MRLIVTGNFDVDEYLELIQNNQAKKTFKNIGSIKGLSLMNLKSGSNRRI